jgi:hypothetical protein
LTSRHSLRRHPGLEIPDPVRQTAPTQASREHFLDCPDQPRGAVSDDEQWIDEAPGVADDLRRVAPLALRVRPRWIASLAEAPATVFVIVAVFMSVPARGGS